MDCIRRNSKDVYMGLLDQRQSEVFEKQWKRTSSSGDESSPIHTVFIDHSSMRDRPYDLRGEPVKLQNNLLDEGNQAEPSVLRFPFRRLTNAVPQSLRQNIRRLTRVTTIAPIPSYGEKTIGTFGSFVYLVNQIFGAGILALPYVIKASGWLPCFLANIFVAVVAMFGTLMIMRAMTMIQGNQNFERRVEYIPAVEYFLGKRFSFLTELCFYLSIQSLNVMSIVIVAQSIDHLLLSIFGWTAGWVFEPLTWTHGLRYFFTQEQVDVIYLSSDQIVFGITLGYFFNAIICIILSSYTMNENMKLQYASFFFLLSSLTEITMAAVYRIGCLVEPTQACFMISSVTAFLQQLLNPLITFVQYPFSLLWTFLPVASLIRGHLTMPAIFNARDTSSKKAMPRVFLRQPRPFGTYQYGKLFSTFISSYSYVNVIPSWANEMMPHVQVNVVLWWSTLFTSSVYYIFGFILAYAYPNVSSDNIFQEILRSNPTLGLFTLYSIYIFNLFTVLPGIIVYSITTRYNLVNSGVASPRQSFGIGCLLPFCLAWILSNDTYFSTVLQWSSLVFSTIVNFIIPLTVYISACGAQRLAKRNPTRFQSYSEIPRDSTSGDHSFSMREISLILYDYLKSLPSNELDPDLRCLVTRSCSPSASQSLSLYSSTKSLSSLHCKGSPSNILSFDCKENFSPFKKPSFKGSKSIQSMKSRPYFNSNEFRSLPFSDLHSGSTSLQNSPRQFKLSHSFACDCFHSNSTHKSRPMFSKKSRSILTDPFPIGSYSCFSSPRIQTSDHVPWRSKPVSQGFSRALTIEPQKKWNGKYQDTFILPSCLNHSTLHYTAMSYPHGWGHSKGILDCHFVKRFGEGKSKSLNELNYLQQYHTEDSNDAFVLPKIFQSFTHLVPDSCHKTDSRDNLLESQSNSLSQRWNSTTQGFKSFLPSSSQELFSVEKDAHKDRHVRNLPNSSNPLTNSLTTPLLRNNTYIKPHESYKANRNIHVDTQRDSESDTECDHLSEFNGTDKIFSCEGDSSMKKITFLDGFSKYSNSLDKLKNRQFHSEQTFSGQNFTSNVQQSSQKNSLTEKLLLSKQTLQLPFTQNSKKQEARNKVHLLPVKGAEDAYECDEVSGTGELKPIRIHVFPQGPLRTHHLTTTRVLLWSLIAFCILSVGLQIFVDILEIYGWIILPSDDA